MDQLYIYIGFGVWNNYKVYMSVLQDSFYDLDLILVVYWQTLQFYSLIRNGCSCTIWLRIDCELYRSVWSSSCDRDFISMDH